MRVFILTIAFLVSACAPEEDLANRTAEYVIRPENNGFSVLIKIRGLAQAKYQVLADLPQQSPIKINHTDINHGYFQIEGSSFFRCLGNIDIVRPVKLIWEVPGDWKLANSFGFEKKTQEFRASCRQLGSSILAGGPGLRLTPTSFGVLAMTTRHLDPAELIEQLELNMKRVEDFWNDRPEPHFLVLVHHKKEPRGHGGTAHWHAFQLQLKGDETPEQLNYLITHEYIHHWNGWNMRGPPVEHEKDHLDIRWFNEGFTDYYAYRLSNTKTPEEKYAVGQCPLEYCPRNEPLWHLKLFRNDRNYFQVPYYQGRRLAGVFNEQIEAYSGKNLDHLMHDLLARSKREPKFYITQNSFLETVCEGRYMDCSAAKDLINRHVILGESL